MQTLSVEGFSICGSAPRISPHSLNPYCFFAITRVFVLLFIWMISWSQLALCVLSREVKPCVLSWFVLDNVLIFQAQTQSDTAIFFFRTLLGHNGHVCLFAM